MVNDFASYENNDLIYIPTAADLQSMNFLSNKVGNITYTPQQQKDMLEAYIQGDKYLSNNRGKFAERNGSREPFTNIVDLKLEQRFNIKLGDRKYAVAVTYDVFNFTNMLNRNWGRTWYLANDNYSLIQFAGYASANDLTPAYRFTPLRTDKPWSMSTSLTPGLSARWLSQLGFRISF